MFAPPLRPPTRASPKAQARPEHCDAASTSCLLPMNSGVRWCSSVGCTSRMRCWPSIADAARLLDDERERVRLVEQAQLALAASSAIRRIAEHAAAEQVAVEVGDERADVAHAERLPRLRRARDSGA